MIQLARATICLLRLPHLQSIFTLVFCDDVEQTNLGLGRICVAAGCGFGPSGMDLEQRQVLAGLALADYYPTDNHRRGGGFVGLQLRDR